MAFDTIHETALPEIIVNAIKGGISVADDALHSTKKSRAAVSSSLTKATKGLIMEFPVLVSKSNHIESAGIVSKAYEAKFVTLLQLAFSAANITNVKNKDAFDYLSKFHTNLDYDKITVDNFIEIMDNMVQHNSVNMSVDQYNQYKAVTEDMRNLCYYFEDDINESSLNSYKVMNNYGKVHVVKEAKARPGYHISTDAFGTEFEVPDDISNDDIRTQNDTEKLKLNQKQTTNDTQRTYNDFKRTKNDSQRTSNDTRRTNASIERQKVQNKNDAEDLKLKQAKDARDTEIYQRDLLPVNLLSSEVKKANELTPTMLVVNFVVDMGDGNQPINQSVIIGVKAKLYEVDSADVINRILKKNADSNIILQLVKVSTREISFAKDFLLAIDDAKVDALSNSRRGSNNKLWKVLERRALNGKIRRALKMNNYAKAISSLVISQEEAEELLKNNLDVSNPSIIRPIMEKLNLISFAIIDESSESVKFIFDTGDDSYETIPLSKLEKEQKDGMSRKIINLLAKMR